jgi:hypothetical protein
MKVQSSVIALVLVLTSFTSALPSEAKGSSGGGSRSSSSSSSSRSSSGFGSSSRSSGSSSFGSSSRTYSGGSSSGTKSSASAFSRGPSAATTKVAATKAQSLNTSAKPLTPTQLASSGVKTAKPADLGMSTVDTNRLTAMQNSHSAMQSIPLSERNVSNPVYAQHQRAYEQERSVFIMTHPTTYIPVYGSSYGPYDGGQVRYVQAADDASGFEKFLNFLGKLILLGIGGTAVVLLGVAMYSFFKEWKQQKEAEKARTEEAKRRF